MNWLDVVAIGMKCSKEGHEETERGVIEIYTNVGGLRIFKHPVEGKKGLSLKYVDQKMLFELPPVPICRAVARAARPS